MSHLHICDRMFYLLITIITLGICGVHSQSEITIALHKPAYQSSTYGGRKANLSVDGNFNQDDPFCAHGDKEGTTLNWLMVDLLGEYYISEVILTPRRVVNANNNEDKRMNNVFIGVSNSPPISGRNEYPTYPLCSQSPYAVNTTTFENISILCRPNTPPGRYIIVQQPSTDISYLTVCEIQVFGSKLESTSDGNNTCKGNYYGETCDKYCNCKNEINCDDNGTCPNGCDDNWEGDHCDIRKFNENQYVGCFQFNQSSNDGVYNINASSCNITCSGYGFTFAANIMSSISCLCTNTINEKWKTNCSSIQSQYSFYSVCPNGSYGYDCTLRCHCLNNGRCSFMEGVCEGGCHDGWTGPSCNIRNCLIANGGCDVNEICISASCQCKECFNKTFAWSSCEMVQECIGDPSSSNNSAIIGGVLGSFAALFIIITVIILILKYRKKLKPSAPISSKFGNRNLVPPSVLENENELNGVVIDTNKNIKLKNIPEFVEQNRNYFTSNFLDIYKGNISQLYHSKEKKLNRFKNIHPYEHNRVKLDRKLGENKSDYINASFIQNVIDENLIACQGPIIETVEDFWTMVWQQNIGIIIMLCNFVEGKKMKCDQYFPEENSLKYGEYTLQHIKRKLWPSFTMTDLTISDNAGQKRHIFHLHFTEWPDHGVPENIAYFLDFRTRCQKLYEKEKCGIAVHCSAGVGRTGTFIAIYDLLVKGYQGLNLNVSETVNNLRKQRVKMVENEKQYNFIYDAMVEEVKLGQTCFTKKEFTKFYNEIKNTEKSKFNNQLQALGKYDSKIDDAENVRIFKTYTSTYTFCVLRKSEISWKMDNESECYLLFGMENMDTYIPKLNQPLTEEDIFVSLVKEENLEWGKVIEVQRKKCTVQTYANEASYENINFEKEKNVKILLVDSVQKDYLDFLTFMELYKQIQSCNQIAIYMRNNCELGYFVMAVCNIISQLNVFNEVAIFQNLCELCKMFPYQPSRVSIEKLHQIIFEFILTSA